jgi:ferredoxin-type protein NapG
MDRRGFFKNGVEKASRVVVQEMNNKAAERAAHWIRPPYALDELEFLLTCTRCDRCLQACPHDVIFLLPARLGSKVAGTPALDLLNRGCRLCQDWPCVKACEPKALIFPEAADGGQPVQPLLARVSINPAVCLPYNGPECGACASSCPVPAALVWDGSKPRIDANRCVGCGLCREACITEPRAVDIQSLYRTSPIKGAG